MLTENSPLTPAVNAAKTARGSQESSMTGHHESLTSEETVKPPSEKSFGITFAVVFGLIAAWLFWRKHVPIWSVMAAAAALVLPCRRLSDAAGSASAQSDLAQIRSPPPQDRQSDRDGPALLRGVHADGLHHAPGREGPAQSQARQRRVELLELAPGFDRKSKPR